jgi:D-alanyl-D-alanine dipeptidase
MLQMVDALDKRLGMLGLASGELGVAKLKELAVAVLAAIPPALLQATTGCCSRGPPRIRPSVQPIIDSANAIAVDTKRLWDATRRMMPHMAAAHWLAAVARNAKEGEAVWLTKVSRSYLRCSPGCVQHYRR